MTEIRTKIHISLIRAGDTVFHDDKVRTVCPKDIEHGTFMGSTLFGDSYRLGTQPVILVTWELDRASV